MGTTKSDREDLMRDATAMVRRAEFKFADQADPVIAGFRRDGALSVYLHADLAYQFDPSGRLRLAHAHGMLYRTQGTTLASLERVRTQDRTELRRHDLSETELGTFLIELRGRLATMLESLQSRQANVLRQFPEDADVVDEVAAALASILAHEVQLAPAIRGKR